MEIRINEEDYLALLQERQHLRDQRTELQTTSTHLELENRKLKKIIKRTSQYSFRSESLTFELGRYVLPHQGLLSKEQVKEESELAAIWESLVKVAP